MPAKAGIQGRAKRPWTGNLASIFSPVGETALSNIGVTNNIARRAWEHRSEVVERFTKRYAVHRLVYVELHPTMPNAILREKQLKKWRRSWKLRLIEESNPQWRDLYDDLLR